MHKIQEKESNWMLCDC